jgi:hypothetical protein
MDVTAAEAESELPSRVARVTGMRPINRRVDRAQIPFFISLRSAPGADWRERDSDRAQRR